MKNWNDVINQDKLEAIKAYQKKMLEDNLSMDPKFLVASNLFITRSSNKSYLTKKDAKECIELAEIFLKEFKNV